MRLLSRTLGGGQSRTLGGGQTLTCHLTSGILDNYSTVKQNAPAHYVYKRLSMPNIQMNNSKFRFFGRLFDNIVT
jgi:hypothetical protein